MPSCAPQELYGQFDHKLDPKNRIAIPSEWRTADEYPVILLESTDQGFPIVKAFSPEVFRANVDKIRTKAAQMPHVTTADIDRFVGRMYAEALAGTVNAQGKLLIPKKLGVKLELEGVARLVGRGTHFEIWKPEAFDAAKASELAALASLNLEFGVF